MHELKTEIKESKCSWYVLVIVLPSPSESQRCSSYSLLCIALSRLSMNFKVCICKESTFSASSHSFSSHRYQLYEREPKLLEVWFYVEYLSATYFGNMDFPSLTSAPLSAKLARLKFKTRSKILLLCFEFWASFVYMGNCLYMY